MTKRICVLGVGKSGVAAARDALERGDEVTIYAGPSNPSNERAAKPFIEAGVDVRFDTEDVQGAYDLTIACPGIPQTGEFYANGKAAAAELISEPEYAFRLSPERWIAVTGTNGKTTTTSLITYILNHCGYDAASCGNIGNTTIGAVEDRKPDQYLVAEMSSFQIASTAQFSPRSAVLLNITPDHIAWHGSFDAYAAAKFKLFDNMGEGQTAVITDETPSGEKLVSSLRERGARVITVGSRRDADCAFPGEMGELYVRLGSAEIFDVINVHDLQIRGAHNVENVLAAAAVVLDLGCDPAAVREALKAFTPLEHRIEPCGEIGGVEFFNDSKGTNVDATLKCLTAFPDRKIVLLLGGRDKNTDLTELVDSCFDVCSSVVVYGEAAERFEAAFQGSGIPCERVKGMHEAFDTACELARPGEAVVLSPACASFDEFSSFEERGKVFKSYVAAKMIGQDE